MSQAGFTLIELILYVALVTMLLVTAVPFAWNVIEGGVKTGVEQEIYSQARYISERIKKEVRAASAVASCVNTGTLRISLINPDPLKNTGICYDAGNDIVSIVQGNPLPACTAATRLHSTDTRATLFTCTNNTTTGTDNVRVHLIVEDRNLNTVIREEYNEVIDLWFTAETRN